MENNKNIIRQEEPKQGTMSEAIKQVINNQLKQETLEEVADKLSDELHAVFEMNNEDAFLWILNILNKGATWQAKTMFSEADMREAIVKASLSNIDDLIERCDDILRQFNKK
jgi:hypothetical protein